MAARRLVVRERSPSGRKTSAAIGLTPHPQPNRCNDGIGLAARAPAASVERAREGAPAHELHRLGALLGESAERLHYFLVQAYFLV